MLEPFKRKIPHDRAKRKGIFNLVFPYHLEQFFFGIKLEIRYALFLICLRLDFFHIKKNQTNRIFKESCV